MNFNIAEPTDPYFWDPESMLEVELPDPDSFLKIRETLTRIGVASARERALYQSCHILHRRGKYYIVHFLELFALEGKETTLTHEDVRRRNTIAKLLEQWKLCKIVSMEPLMTANLSSIKIVSHKEKKDWDLRVKYTMMSQRKQNSGG